MEETNIQLLSLIFLSYLNFFLIYLDLQEYSPNACNNKAGQDKSMELRTPCGSHVGGSALTTSAFVCFLLDVQEQEAGLGSQPRIQTQGTEIQDLAS